MKSFIRKFVLSIISLYITSKLITGFKISQDFSILAKISFLFTILNFFVKPVIKVLTLPLNFVSFGLFSLIINGLTIYLLTYFSPEVKITPWYFPGLNYKGFALPSYNFSFFYTLILISLVVSLIINFFSWICKK